MKYYRFPDTKLFRAGFFLFLLAIQMLTRSAIIPTAFIGFYPSQFLTIGLILFAGIEFLLVNRKQIREIFTDSRMIAVIGIVVLLAVSMIVKQDYQAVYFSIMLYLLRKGLEPKMSFDIMEAVRKGKVAKNGFQPGWEEAMREHDVPDWYIESCRRIKYMFPKAHAVAYLIAAIRLMWFKVYHPQVFYAVYFTVRGADIDYEAAIGGVRVAQQHIKDIERLPKEERNAKTDDMLVSLQIENEMLQRGYEFLPIQLGKSRASKYLVEDGKVRLPFSALKGVGETAAIALEQATAHGQQYISIEELQQASGVSGAIMESLRRVGALGDLPETSQVSFFG